MQYTGSVIFSCLICDACMHAVAFLTIPGRTRRMGQKDRLNSAKLI